MFVLLFELSSFSGEIFFWLEKISSELSLVLLPSNKSSKVSLVTWTQILFSISLFVKIVLFLSLSFASFLISVSFPLKSFLSTIFNLLLLILFVNKSLIESIGFSVLSKLYFPFFNMLVILFISKPINKLFLWLLNIPLVLISNFLSIFSK